MSSPPRTDSEAVAHLVAEENAPGLPSRGEAVAAALGGLKGAFALVFLFAAKLDLLIGARRGSPLAVGWGDDGVLSWLRPRCAWRLSPKKSLISKEDDWVDADARKTTFFDAAGRIVERARRPFAGRLR